MLILLVTKKKKNPPYADGISSRFFLPPSGLTIYLLLDLSLRHVTWRLAALAEKPR